MPIWYDPATRQPYIFQESASGFKQLIGAKDFTVSFKNKPPSGLGRTAVRGSRWWYPQQQTMIVLKRVEDTHVFGKVCRLSFTLDMPISRKTFLLEYRYVPPIVGTYWDLRSRDADIREARDILHITSVRDFTVSYEIPKARHVSNRYIQNTRPAHSTPVIHFIDLLRVGYQRELPVPGDIWVDFHAEDVEIVQVFEAQVTYRNLMGGVGTCPLHEFFYLFERRTVPEPDEPAEDEQPEEDPKSVWDRIS